jgi:O-antigen/teichoic acid export membrane protein
MMAVKRAILLSASDRYFALLCNFTTTAVVSRMLTPAEIGIAVIGTAILGIALSLREFASGSFIIQRQSLTREDVRVAFSAMLVLTVAITAALAALSPALVAAYAEQKLVAYFTVTSGCLFVDLIAIQVLNLLRRDMAFGRVAAINISGAVVGSCTTLALAWLGFSYMSFAWSWLATSIVTATLALYIRPYFWMFNPCFRRWRAIAEFGGYNGAIVFLYKAYESLPFLLLGRAVSPYAAALLSRSFMICQIPDKVILGGAISVLLPAFSVHARQGQDLKGPYLRSVQMITVFYWPALLTLSVLAGPVVELLLGHQWHGVVFLVRTIAIASLFSFSFELNYPVMVALGSIREMFIRALVVVPVAATMMVAGVLLGGLHGAAISMLFIVPFQAFVTLTYVRRRLEMSWSELGMAVHKSGIVAVATAGGALAAVLATGATLNLALSEGILASLLAAIAWMAALLLTRHPVLEELAGSIPAFRKLVLDRVGLISVLTRD